MLRRERHRLDEATVRLVRETDLFALRRAGFARVVVAALILMVILIATDGAEIANPTVRAQIAAAEITLLLFGVAGWSVAFAAARHVGVPALPTIAATIDAVLIFGNMAFNHWGLGISGSFFAVFPVIWVAPITMAATAIYYQPRLQAYMAAVYTAAFALLVVFGSEPSPETRGVSLAEMAGQFSSEANSVRVVMIGAFAVILVLVARQGRYLLERAVRETTMRLNLTRYLPSELAPILTEQAFATLRAGRRIRVTLLFVDIRASSIFGENMDPAQLAVFISSFRRRVIRAAGECGGMIDKFTGDGALVLFGVPTPSPSDAARALNCAHVLLGLVDRWNEKRGFNPPVRVGIGIHTGEVFCGVVGDEDRLEFTVLGETVNTGARIEQATKTVGEPLLVSLETLEAAGTTTGWSEVDGLTLPGVTRSICVLRPSSAETAET
jgi:adenylate cyclase